MIKAARLGFMMVQRDFRRPEDFQPRGARLQCIIDIAACDRQTYLVKSAMGERDLPGRGSRRYHAKGSSRAKTDATAASANSSRIRSGTDCRPAFSPLTMQLASGTATFARKTPTNRHTSGALTRVEITTTIAACGSRRRIRI